MASPRINIFKLIVPGLQLDIITKLKQKSQYLWYDLCYQSRYTLLDAVKYKKVKIYEVLPTWKREYYNELEEKNTEHIAAHAMTPDELRERLSKIDTTLDEELLSIIEQYSPLIQTDKENDEETVREQLQSNAERLKIPEQNTLWYRQGYPNETYRFSWRAQSQGLSHLISDLYPDSIVPVEIAKMLTPEDLAIVEDLQYDGDNGDVEDLYAKKLIEYFDDHDYEYYYFGVYNKNNPALMSRNRQLPYEISGRQPGRKLLPNAINFERGAGGPNMNKDLMTWRLYSGDTKYGSGSSPSNNGTILTWGVNLLAEMMEEMLGRLPSWSDIGISRPVYESYNLGRKRWKSLEDPNALSKFKIYPATPEQERRVVYEGYREGCITIARMIFGAYDYWNWDDIKRRRYYRLIHLQWIASTIYLFNNSVIDGLDYDQLVELIKTRAIPRRKMSRPVTVNKTKKFFNIPSLDIELAELLYKSNQGLLRLSDIDQFVLYALDRPINIINLNFVNYWEEIFDNLIINNDNLIINNDRDLLAFFLEYSTLMTDPNFKSQLNRYYYRYKLRKWHEIIIKNVYYRDPNGFKSYFTYLRKLISSLTPLPPTSQSPPSPRSPRSPPPSSFKGKEDEDEEDEEILDKSEMRQIVINVLRPNIDTFRQILKQYLQNNIYEKSNISNASIQSLYIIDELIENDDILFEVSRYAMYGKNDGLAEKVYNYYNRKYGK